jgi:Flp pilus assembly protein TadG
MTLFRLIKDAQGASAVEFGLIAPVFFAALLGLIEVGLLFWTQLGLQHATEMAARCASINSTTCGSATAVQNYAVTQAFGLSLPPSTFSLTALTCGNQVTASHSFQSISAFFGVPALTLSARACFPKN